jgi:uncharacterized protein
MVRRDIAFPLRFVGGQAASAAYPAHIGQMVRQVLLTDPGERVCLPSFGAGLRRLLFAPVGTGIDAAVELAVRQALDTWLGDQIVVRKVAVAGPDDGAITIEIVYELVETREEQAQTIELVT